MALMKYPRTKAHPDFQKKPAAVLAASPNEDQYSIENKSYPYLFLLVRYFSEFYANALLLPVGQSILARLAARRAYSPAFCSQSFQLGEREDQVFDVHIK